MKKLIIILVISLITFSSFAAEEDVDPKIIEAFKKEFVTAKDVNWVVNEEFVVAEFTFNNQHINAYYSHEAQLIGLARNISSFYLPVYLQASLMRAFGEYWITGLIEVTKNNSTAYHATLENAQNIIKLKAFSGGDWSRYSKTEKE